MFGEAFVCGMVLLVLWWYFSEEDPLDKLPGLPRLPIIGNAHQFAMFKPDNVLQDLMELTKSYGYRYIAKILNIRVLHVIDPADVEVILTHSKNTKKSKPYQFMKDWLGNGLLLSYGSNWHKRRKILTPAFHFNILKNFSVIIEEKTKDLIKLLKEKNGADVEVMTVISDYTLYTICETAMGTKLDKDKSAATVEYKNSVLNMGNFIMSRLVKIWTWNDLFFKTSSQGRKYFETCERAKAFSDNVIMDRKARHIAEKGNVKTITEDEFGTKKRLAMLDLLLEAEANGEIDMEGIRDEVNTFMFEGHDTTAMAITFGLMLLADHEDIQERILEDIKNVMGDTDRTPSMSELANMKYLDAVIKEVLRLYPSVPIIGRETVEDFMLDDLLVKKGTITDLHIYEIHHREDLFPDAEAFKPERFLGTEIKNTFSYIPFSAGPRNCIGQRFAMQEMRCAFSEIIRNFKLVPKIKGARPKLKADLVIRPVEPIYVKFILR